MPRDNKRQCNQTAAMATTSPAPSKPQTAIGVATMAIDSYVESLSKEVQPTLSRKAKAYLHEVASAMNKLEISMRMTADEEFIPRSARINFTIKSNQATSETEEYKTLVEENDRLVSETKQKFRDNIMASMALEMGQRLTKVATLLLTGVNLCVKIALIETKESPACELDATRQVSIALFPAVDETTAITDVLMTDELNKMYPPPTTQASTAGEQAACPKPVVTRARELAAALFILPLRKWHKAKKAQKLREKLRAIVIAETKQATEAATMEVENEPTMSESKMKDLIKEAVSKETAALKKELARLKSAKQSDSLHPKGKRGQRQGASEKEKKSGNNKTKKKTPGKNVRLANDNDDRADDAGSASRKSGGALRQSSYQSSTRKNNKNKKNSRRNSNKGQAQN